MGTAHKALQCWLLLCSDLAIRAGTAAMLGPSNYDRQTGLLRFRTKYGNAQVLPVTGGLRSLLNECTDPALPFVAQLSRGKHWTGSTMGPMGTKRGGMNYQGLSRAFLNLKRSLGITRKLTAHDLRRTTARTVYKASGDLRIAQALLGHTNLSSTVWYLQDAHEEVDLKLLELAKLNPPTETIQ